MEADNANGELKFKMDDYQVIEQIRREASGASFLVLHKAEQKKYVLKKIRLPKQTEKFKRTAQQEMHVISKLYYPYIVEFKDIWMTEDNCVCIVTKHCEGGDMASLIKKARGVYFPEEKICKWMAQLLLAIDYLHTNRIIHRNLKCSNIFLTKENDMQLGDVGLGKLLSPDTLSYSSVGSPNYMCPELLSDVPYGYKSDIWSLGCCIFEIAAHHPAFQAPDKDGLLNKINRALLSSFPIMYNPSLKQMIKSMLRKNPEHRPTAAELLRHPHLQPYLVRCRNASPVYLPVRSPNAKDKTPKRGSPVKPLWDSDTRPREGVRALKLTGHHVDPPRERSGNNMPPNNHHHHHHHHHCHQHHQNYDKSSTSATSDENLETKRVDPFSYSSRGGAVCDACESSKCVSSGRETIVSNVQEETVNSSPLLNQREEKETSTSVPRDFGNVQNNNLEDAAQVQQWLEVHVEGDGGLENHKDQGENQKGTKEDAAPQNNTETSISSEDRTSSKTGVQDPANRMMPSSSSTVEDKGEENGLSSHQSKIINNNHDSECTETSTIGLPLPSEADTALKKHEAIGDSLKASDNNDNADDDGVDYANRTPGEISLLNNLKAAMRGDSNSVDVPTHQRADALESLLELCARLLKEDKLNELSGVLRPFGEETVSSRETAIWLTKSLMAAQKSAKGG